MKNLYLTLLSLFLAASLIFNIGMYAGTTGKIQGTILDSESSEPLPGVNVIIEGTTLGAATDETGFYFIINIPPGTYSLRASMVGYANETQSDVRVFVDRTTSGNFELKSAAVAGEEVTVTATRDPVPLDVSQTEAYISGENVATSPAGRFDELMSYQAGVEFSTRTTSYNSGRGFSVRGGEVAETDVQIDGISMMNKQEQQVAMPLSRNLIQDVQILTGGFNAEYGNIRSGLINIITKDGSYNRYSGVLEGRYSPKADKVFFPDQYNSVHSDQTEIWQLHYADKAFTGVDYNETYHWKNRPDNNWNYYQTWMGFDSYAASRPYGAQFYYDLDTWVNRPFPYMTTGDVMLDLSGGGPVPGIPDTKFYASGFWNRSEFAVPAAREHSQEYNTSLKVTKRIGANMVLVFSNYEVFTAGVFSGSRGSARRGGLSATYMTGDDWYAVGRSRHFDQRRVWNTHDINKHSAKTHNFGLKFTHTYSPATYYELNFAASLYDGDVTHGPGTDLSIIKYIKDAETGTEFGFDEFPRGWTPEGNTNASGWTFGRYSAIRSYMRYGAEGLFDNLMVDYNLRLNVVSQINRYNQVKGGIHLAYTHSNERASFNWTAVPSAITLRPYEWSKWKADPVQFEWFIQDKLEWEGMILNAGIRGLSWFPRVDGLDVGVHNFFQYDDLGNPYWVAGAQWGSVEGEGNWMWRQWQTRKVKHKMLLMPRLGISHPITTSSKIFFNYGHFYSSPHWNQMYAIQSVTSLGGIWGRTGLLPIPDINWPKTVSYEIGYSQSFYDQLLLQISGYYKDYTNDIVSTGFNNYTNDINTYTYENHRYRDIRGVEFRAERSFGRFVNGWANYNYMITSTGSTGFEYFYQDPTLMNQQYYSSGQSKPEAVPNFRLNFSLRTPVGWGPGTEILGVKPLAEWRFNFLWSWQARPRYLINSSDPPKDWIYVDQTAHNMIDIYINKRLARGAQFYINVQNVFNFKKQRLDSGSYRDSLHFWYETGEQHGNDKIGDTPGYAYLGQPIWRQFYPEARDIYFGIRYQF